jgi:DNA-binding response OmpR family regulator
MPRILLVEDDPGVLLLFEEVLFGAGYQVDTADTFRAADDLLALREYDLLLSDGWLPDGTGMSLADHAKLKGIPALLVTAYIDRLWSRGPVINLNNYNVLQKPLTPGVLLAAVSEECLKLHG